MLGLWLARWSDLRLGVSSVDHWWFCGAARVAPCGAVGCPVADLAVCRVAG